MGVEGSSSAKMNAHLANKNRPTKLKMIYSNACIEFRSSDQIYLSSDTGG